MYYFRCISPFIFSFAATTMAHSQVESLLLRQHSFAEIKTIFTLTSTATSKKMLAAFSPPNTLVLVREHTDEMQRTHVRLQQHYRGFPVYGGYAITHGQATLSQLLETKQDIAMNGMVYKGLEPVLGEAPSDFLQHGKQVLEQWKARYEASLIKGASVTPLIYVDEKNNAFWAYKIGISLSYPDRIPVWPTAIINAKTEKVLLAWNSLKTAYSQVDGLGFGGNGRTGLYQFGHTLPFLHLSRNDATATCYMQTPEIKVVDMAHQTSGVSAPMHFSCRIPDATFSNAYWLGYKEDGYDLENGAYSPTNDALYAGQVIKQMYQAWYGIPVLASEHGKTMPLVMRVHFGKGYENAFWDGKQMTFGDGSSLFYPLVSLGIGAHEVSHGFTEQHSDLEYVGQSGAMNESFSDMASQLADYYSNGRCSWRVGENVFKESSGHEALRFMDKPSRDGKSIDTAKQYKRTLDVHYSSGVYNRLFYLLSTTAGWDPRKAFHTMLKANMDYWTPYSTFEEGACGILSATTDLGYSTEAVKHALDAVEIPYGAC